MGDRWINAVVEVTVPLDIRIDAPDEEKREAVSDLMTGLTVAGRDRDASLSGRWELVEDGEPV